MLSRGKFFLTTIKQNAVFCVVKKRLNLPTQVRKILSILLLLLLLLQATPVLHFIVQKEVCDAYFDEKAGDFKEVKEGKEYLTAFNLTIRFSKEEKTYPSFVVNDYSSPSLEYLIPPPNVC